MKAGTPVHFNFSEVFVYGYILYTSEVIDFHMVDESKMWDQAYQ